MKRTIPLLITFLAGLTLVLERFIPSLGESSNLATQYFNVLAGFAFVLGAGNLLRVHLERVAKQQRQWGYSVITLIAFFAVAIPGFTKFGVQPRPGLQTTVMEGQNDARAFATIDFRPKAARTMVVAVVGLEPHAEIPVTAGDGKSLGVVQTNEDGAGELQLDYVPPIAGETPSAEATTLANLEAGQKISIGGVVSGEFAPYSRMTKDFKEDGTPVWFLFTYGITPLGQAMFSMLAFYIASAAFRAFRARNIEAILLLGTAFVILLGRTYIGTAATGWMANIGEEGSLTRQFLSFWEVPNFTAWIMQIWNTAGNRAILIGIALGVASTSLKVLLGIDRSHVGSE